MVADFHQVALCLALCNRSRVKIGRSKLIFEFRKCTFKYLSVVRNHFLFTCSDGRYSKHFSQLTHTLQMSSKWTRLQWDTISVSCPNDSEQNSQWKFSISSSNFICLDFNLATLAVLQVCLLKLGALKWQEKQSSQLSMMASVWTSLEWLLRRCKKF